MQSSVHTDITRLLTMLKATGKNYDLEKIQRAFEYANALHDGQRRASGEAYISHPIAVAEIVASLELDTDSICAALLHDTVEDCADKTDLKELEKKFGKDVALLVDGTETYANNVKAILKSAGTNVIEDVLYVKCGLPFFASLKPEDEAAVIDWLDNKVINNLK